MLIVLGFSLRLPDSFSTSLNRFLARDHRDVGTIAASGVRIVSRERLNRRAIMIMALSLAVGMGVSQHH